jgi:glutathione synthase/RimK-type ligase-like ATP-grasp enzyme
VSLDAKGGDHTELDLLPERLDLAEVTAIWHRAPSATRIPAEVLHAPLQAYVPRAAAHFLDDVFEPLRCLQVPARHSALRRAGYKIAQLRRASAHGFEIPPTLVSNDPQRILEFVREHEGRVISKTLDPLLSSQFLYPRYSRYTEAFSRRDTGYLSSARHAAAIFQAEVAKRIEIRVMVVDGQIFAAEIHSQVARRTRRDWRRYDPFSTPIRPHALPACEAERCRSLLAEFELRYGALDFILTPDGRYVFLEINTNGQYLWLEHATRLPISDAIARLLGRAESCHG